MSKKDGFDSEKRWGNEGLRGHGINSPAMMEARKGFANKKHEVAKKMGNREYRKHGGFNKLLMVDKSK